MELQQPKNIDRLAYVRGLLTMYGIRNRHIAQYLGVTDSLVGHVLNGRGKSRRVRQAAAHFLNKPYEELWDEAA